MSEIQKPKTVLVPIADGTEEIEAVTIIDTLRRAGAEVTVASATKELQVTCSRKTKLVADVTLEFCENKKYDLIAIPGGMPGAKNLSENKILSDLLSAHIKSQGYVTAICAAPAVVLGQQGFLKDKKSTCYPNPQFEALLPKHVDDRVVIDSNVVTSQGPGTALEFSLTLVKLLFGDEEKEKLRKQMLVKEF
eukprot:TRINITY_DN5349_c0_g1_i1.p1 TRINITY_DN5349_c0_g1~~TRINITY_DN5349_c0_g1_i1.p1  ORF type:complete len:192 (+),score=38.34 TRINITY_DN5349_c0_g1_i1:66-641(+)